MTMQAVRGAVSFIALEVDRLILIRRVSHPS